ncbi:hypothetical protein, partial [Acinetobacter baumannii]|uniref:hypothetical protein n=1 Tax=Acinetobacter baumannii TaxID=470 RepID=UPI001EF329B1
DPARDIALCLPDKVTLAIVEIADRGCRDFTATTATLASLRKLPNLNGITILPYFWGETV